MPAKKQAPLPQEIQQKAEVEKVDPYQKEIIASINERLISRISEREDILEVLPSIKSKLSVKDLKRVDIPTSIISELKKKTDSLNQPSLEDEAGFNEVKKWRLVAKNIRTTLSNITKDGREDLNRKASAWVAKEKELSKLIKEGAEDRLEGFEKEWLRLTAEEERKKKEEQSQRFTKRLLELSSLVKEATGNDLTLDQDTQSFILNDLSIQMLIVEEADDEIYESILSQFKEAAAIAKAEKEKKDEEEAKRIINTRRVNRANILAELKATPFAGDLGTMEENEWVEIYNIAFKLHNDLERDRLAAERDEEIRITAVGTTRKQVLASLGFTYDKNDLGVLTDEEWEIKLLKAQDYRRELNEKRERERLEAATDKERWLSFLVKIGRIELPTARTKTYKEKINAAITFIENIKNL
jgi:hypothetical protein